MTRRREDYFEEQERLARARLAGSHGDTESAKSVAEDAVARHEALHDIPSDADARIVRRSVDLIYWGLFLAAFLYVAYGVISALFEP